MIRRHPRIRPPPASMTPRSRRSRSRCPRESKNLRTPTHRHRPRNRLASKPATVPTNQLAVTSRPAAVPTNRPAIVPKRNRIVPKNRSHSTSCPRVRRSHIDAHRHAATKSRTDLPQHWNVHRIPRHRTGNDVRSERDFRLRRSSDGSSVVPHHRARDHGVELPDQRR